MMEKCTLREIQGIKDLQIQGVAPKISNTENALKKHRY